MITCQVYSCTAVIIVLLSLSTCFGTSRSIPTAIRKSNNTSGFVCIHVTRGRSPREAHGSGPNPGEVRAGRGLLQYKDDEYMQGNLDLSMAGSNALPLDGDTDDVSMEAVPASVLYSKESLKTAPVSPTARPYSLLRPVRRRPYVLVTLIVQLKNYHTRFVAGETLINSTWLTEGYHQLQYQHTVHDGKHSLIVLLDGAVSPFETSSVRDPMALFSEPNQVWIKLQGPVSFANRTCIDSSSDSVPLAAADGPTPSFTPYSPVDESVDVVTESPETLADDDDPPTFRDNILDEVNLRNDSLSQKIIFKSRLYNSNVTLSFIHASRLYGCIVSNSVILDSTLRNTTVFNSTFSNVSLIHSVVYNVTRAPSESIDEDQATPHGPPSVAMLAYGTIGIVLLVLIVVVGSFLALAFVVKRRKERLLVRSAVMGDIRSW